jgi:cobalt-zinc-cadmium efflux system membrane fusion protein
MTSTITPRRMLLMLVPLALLAAGAFGVYRFAARDAPRQKPQTQAPAQLGPATLRYPPGAPQLSFLRIQPVAAYPEPVTETLNGRIAYNENLTARVSSPIAGRITKLLKEPGDPVKAGDPLAEIDAPDFAAANADARRAEAEVTQKRAAFDRTRTLVEGEVAPRKDLETAQSDLKQSEAELTRARERLRILNFGRSATGDRFVLRAPISGIVTERKANPGSEVRPDLPDPLFVISDPTRLWMVIDVPERVIARIARGQSVAIEVDAYPAERYGERFVGLIDYVGDVLDPDTRRVPVRALVANPKRMLKPEMFARATPIAPEARELVRIPNSALATEGLYSFVFVEKEPGVLEQRPITLAIRGRDESFLAEGLKPGERIVTSGAMLLNSELVSGD